MSRHFWRACHREAGFTMMEMLVTIIIAGIFFAAMIPFLASAQQKTAGDNMRNIALQVARDKVEKLRQLDYDKVDATWLSTHGPTAASRNASGQFGTLWVASSGTGAKDFTITYVVTPVAATATQAEYKSVEVSVVWSGAPTPRVPAILQTSVSRQYFGPQVVDLRSPDAVQDTTDPNNPVMTIAAGGMIHLNATVSDQDLSQMTGTPLGTVTFAVTDVSGNSVASGSTSTRLSTGEYQWQWDSSTASTGNYIFTATASSGSGSQGNTWSVMYSVKATNLDAPSPVNATAGDQSVSLTWGAVASADHYQVLRSTVSGAETVLADNLKVCSYLDSNPPLVNGTTYYYRVRAVASGGRLGALSSEVSCVPVLGNDATAPTAPSNVTGAPTDTTIALAWTASVDNPPPSTPSGVVQYQVWRSSVAEPTPKLVGTVNGTQAVPPATSFTDTGLTKSTTYTYKVMALDGNNKPSPFSASVNITTLSVTPTGSQTVHNGSKGNTPMLVTMYNTGTLRYYAANGTPSTTAIWVTVNSTGQGNTTWTPLPVGSYVITAKAGAVQLQQGPVAVTTGSNPTVSFSF